MHVNSWDEVINAETWTGSRYELSSVQVRISLGQWLYIGIDQLKKDNV